MDAPDRDIAQAKDFIAPPAYQRHRPETTLLYQLVAEHYPGFRDRRAAEGRPLPRYVEDEFDAYLQCGLLEHGFLRVKCDACQAEKLVAFSCKRRGFCPSCGARRMADECRDARGRAMQEQLPRRRHCSWTTSCRSSPFANGCCRCRLHCAPCWRRGPRWSRRCSVSSIERSRAI